MTIAPDYKGKVRDVYNLGDKLILSSSDRISAFDVVFDEIIAGKGVILNTISNLWFNFFQNIPNHIIETDFNKFPHPFNNDSYFKDRAVLVKKCERINYECVVRGYLAGSGYKEYKEFGALAGLKLPQGLTESEKLPEPIFTPAIKNDTGHDENISAEAMRQKIGDELFVKLKNTSLEIYRQAAARVESVGLILCDTKFEFGILAGEVILIDELLTPDSSRYWDMREYNIGISPPSFDKQILRNFLEKSSWNKMPPPIKLPEELIVEIIIKYKKLQELIKSCISQK